MITLSHPISGGDFDGAGAATRKLKEQLARIGVEASALRRAMIAAYEAEMNVVIHARTGTLWARLDDGKLDLEITDEGPGIPDVELALREGWSTAPEKARQMGFGAGMGLPNIRRSSDLFEIDTRVGRGTRVRATILLTAPAAPQAASGSVTFLSVDETRCRGCRRCIFACPTAALRVRGTHPSIRRELCIGCAACIDACPDDVFRLFDARSGQRDGPIPPGALLIVPRGFLHGFPGGQPPARVLDALHDMGFADVLLLEEWEEALRSEVRREAGSAELPQPRIPPLCLPLVTLIESRFPALIPNLSPWLSPAEAAWGEFPLRPVAFAAACPAQYGACAGASVTERLTVVDPSRLARAVLARRARATAQPGVPAPARVREQTMGAGELSVSGVADVLRALSLAETGSLRGVSVLELHLCAGGCSASPLASARRGLAAVPWESAAGQTRREARASAAPRPRPYVQRPGVRLDDDMAQAIRKLSLIDRRAKSLPGRDCGSCGSPSCAALAEDIVMGRAEPALCPFTEKSE